MKLTTTFTATTFLIAAVIATTLLLYPRGQARSDSEMIEVPRLTQEQEVWLSALQWCESRGRDDAVNKVDRDGTPSFGRYQFKISTYAFFSKKYGLASTTDYMNGEQQREIVIRMLLDKDISDSQLRTRQFPDCIQHKIGLPKR